MSGTLHNTVGSGILPYQQEIRIKLTSNEPIKDSEWSITGYLTRLHYKTLWVEQIMLLKKLSSCWSY